MTRFAAFRSQLAAIMEALSRAAVADICELLDDSYAVFELELRRSHAENQALRRKLELIQDVVARGHRGGPAAEALTGPGEGEPGFGLPPPPEPGLRGDVFHPERSSASGGGLHQPREDCRGRGRVSAATAPPAGGDESPAAGAEEFSEQDLMKDKSIKTEEDDAADGRLVRGDGPELRFLDKDPVGGASRKTMTSAVDAAPWEQSGPQRPSASAPGSPTRALRLPPEVLFARTSEPGRVSPPAPQTRRLFLGGPGGSPSASHRPDPDGDLSSAWTPQGLSSLLAVPHRLLDGGSDLSAAGRPSAPGPAGSRSGPLDQNPPCRDRRFVCSCCRKGFTSSRSLETHMRVHTGERPYGCPQCGKRFTQSGHLKTHQSVHTGERPFACQHCGKRFAGKQNLRIHQQKHHPAERGGA